MQIRNASITGPASFKGAVLPATVLWNSPGSTMANGLVVSNGGTTLTAPSAIGYTGALAGSGKSSGKYYIEYIIDSIGALYPSSFFYGVSSSQVSLISASTNPTRPLGSAYAVATGEGKYINHLGSVTTPTGAPILKAGDRLTIAADIGLNSIYFYRNGVNQYGSGVPASTTYFPFVMLCGQSSSVTIAQTPMYPRSGFELW